MATPVSFDQFVSVVIPCHNAARWIAQTMASVVAQTAVSFEVVLVDDGSDDGSAEIAARTAGAVGLRIFTQQRMGVSRARNVGTAAARGAFVQYLDADDVLAPGILRAQLDALTTTGADVGYCNWARLERQQDGAFALGETVTRTLGESPEIDLFTGLWWPPGALMYRRTLVDRILPWREDLPIIQDARFHLDAALSGARFVHVDRLGLHYRVHGVDSLSRRNPVAFLEDCYRNTSSVHRLWEEADRLDGARRSALVESYSYLARSFVSLDRERFLEIAGRLEMLDPGFLRRHRPAFRALSRVVGYPTAERMSAWVRRMKAAPANDAAAKTA